MRCEGIEEHCSSYRLFEEARGKALDARRRVSLLFEDQADDGGDDRALGLCQNSRVRVCWSDLQRDDMNTTLQSPTTFCCATRIRRCGARPVADRRRIIDAAAAVPTAVSAPAELWDLLNNSSNERALAPHHTTQRPGRVLKVPLRVDKRHIKALVGKKALHPSPSKTAADHDYFSWPSFSLAVGHGGRPLRQRCHSARERRETAKREVGASCVRRGPDKNLPLVPLVLCLNFGPSQHQENCCAQAPPASIVARNKVPDIVPATQSGERSLSRGRRGSQPLLQRHGERRGERSAKLCCQSVRGAGGSAAWYLSSSSAEVSLA